MIDPARLYQQPLPSDWQGRHDAGSQDYFYQIIQLLDLQHLPENLPPGIALLGFASDIGVRRNLGRPGAAAGSQAIKQALARLAVQKSIRLYDVGLIVPVDDDLEAAQFALGTATRLLLEKKLMPIVLGGGHETAWGHYQGLANYLGQKSLSIINFDAHFDLRDIPANQQGTSGTPFRQIAQACAAQNLPFDYSCLGIQEYANTQHLFQVAKQLGVKYLLAKDMHLNAPKFSADFLQPILQQAERIYVSICLDAFAIEHAPGVSAPQVLGITPWQVMPLLKQIQASNKLFSLDIVELAPQYDADQRTSKLAASILSDIIHGL